MGHDDHRHPSADQYRDILEHAQDAIIATTPDGMAYLNHAAKHLYGFAERTGDDLHSLNLQRYVLEAFQEFALDGTPIRNEARPLVRALRGETYSNVELMIQHREHSEPRIFVFSGRSVPGAPPLNVLTIRDETDRWRSERRYRISLDMDPAPTLIVRLEDAVIIDSNEGMSDMTGMERDELIGANVLTVDLFAYAGGFADVIEALSNGDRVHKQKAALVDDAGRLLEVLVSARAIEIGGRPACIFTFLDITELEQARRDHFDAQEALTRARNRLAERREHERASLARDLHDDVLQYLLALNADLALEEREFEAAGNTAAAEALRRNRERVLHSAVQLRRTIRGYRPGDLRAVGLWSALKEALQDFQFAAKTEVVLPNAAPPDLPEEALLLLYRVTHEAVLNALKHARPSRVAVTFEQQDGELVLQVQDDGAGFEVPQHLAALERSNHFGLISMEERIAAHGGTLEITSAPGQGTIIRCRLPRPGGRSMETSPREAHEISPA